jgi:hypothetical protein
MTPQDQPPDGPWHQHWPTHPSAAQSGEGPGRDLGRELIEAAVIVVVSAVLGALLAWLWLTLAPRVPLELAQGAVILKDSEAEDSIAIDGTFALLGLAFGAVMAAAVFLVRKRGGIPLVLALAVGGVLGSLLAWKMGVWLGPTEDVVAHAKQVGPGKSFDAPLQLRAKGALLAWPAAAMVVHLVLTGLFGPKEPLPAPPPPLQHGGWQGWGKPPADGAQGG